MFPLCELLFKCSVVVRNSAPQGREWKRRSGGAVLPGDYLCLSHLVKLLSWQTLTWQIHAHSRLGKTPKAGREKHNCLDICKIVRSQARRAVRKRRQTAPLDFLNAFVSTSRLSKELQEFPHLPRRRDERRWSHCRP